MKLSKIQKQKIYDAISNSVLDLRVDLKQKYDNHYFSTIFDEYQWTDDKLFFLIGKIYAKIKKDLNIKD